jgi:DNA-binding NarL/FixJ family response regulator
MAVEVLVQASSEVLRFSLVRQLQYGGDLAVDASTPSAFHGRATIVVIPVADCSAFECRDLVESGAAVIVLAALPSDKQRDSYLNAGATAYVSMTPGSPELLDAVSNAASTLQRDVAISN